MNENEIKEKTIKGLFWKFVERIFSQLISFVVSIILARILMPEDYGLIALVIIVINLLGVFVNSGLGTSLVQKKEVDNADYSTLFWSNLCISILIYTLIYILAPFIANIYNNQTIIYILRIMGLNIPIMAIYSIQQAYMQRNMLFKKLLYSTIIGSIISAIVGISMAINGFGVWSLVWQYITNTIINTIVLNFIIKLKPSFIFSKDRFKKLFSYAWRITVSSFIGTFFEQIRGIVIGTKYSSTDLAFNNRGEQIPLVITNNINATMESVLFPSISKLQDDKEKVKRAMSRMIKTSSFILMPLLIGLFAVVEPVVKILLTDKWIECVPYLKIVCIQQCFSIINTINLQAIKAIGRSDIILKLEFIKKPILIIIILLTMYISPIAICIGNAIYTVIALIINSFPNKKILNYSAKDQIYDILIYFVLSIIMGLIVLSLGKLNLDIVLLLIIQITVGGVFYLCASKLLKLDSYEYIKNTIKSYLKKGKANEENY